MSADVIGVVLDLVMKEAGSSDRQRGFSVVGGLSRLDSEGFQCVLQQVRSGSGVRVRFGALVSCVTTALVSRQTCDGQERDAIGKMRSHMPANPGAESVEDHACNVRELVGIGPQTDTFAAHFSKWEESAARRTRVQQCA